METERLKALLDGILEDLSKMNMELAETIETLDEVNDDIEKVANQLANINKDMGEWYRVERI